MFPEFGGVVAQRPRGAGKFRRNPQLAVGAPLSCTRSTTICRAWIWESLLCFFQVQHRLNAAIVFGKVRHPFRLGALFKERRHRLFQRFLVRAGLKVTALVPFRVRHCGAEGFQNCGSRAPRDI